MALFWTTKAPSPAPTNLDPSIKTALEDASRKTGTDFDYLVKTAIRESGLREKAVAKTSSAAGLFQFIENTWLKTIKDKSSELGHGLEKYGEHIFRTQRGRYYVPDREMRKEILDLRLDAEIASVVAGVFTRQNAATVSRSLGRQPTDGELYIAHFMGPDAATKLIREARSGGAARADKLFPEAAAANKALFYDGRRARSVRELYDSLVSRHSQDISTTASRGPLVSKAPIAPVSFNPVEPLFNFPDQRSTTFSPQRQIDEAGTIGTWRTDVLSENDYARRGAVTERGEGPAYTSSVAPVKAPTAGNKPQATPKADAINNSDEFGGGDVSPAVADDGSDWIRRVFFGD